MRPLTLLAVIFGAFVTTHLGCSVAEDKKDDAGTDTGSVDDTGGGDADGGIDSGADAPTDVPVDGDAAPPKVVQVAAYGNVTCVVFSTGAVKCWGDNRFGQAGVATKGGPGPCGGTASPDCLGKPNLVAGIDDAKSIAVGDSHVCALKKDGTVACWGSNLYGQLGQTLSDTCATSSAGTVPCSTKALVVPALSGVTDLAAGGQTTCAKAADKVFCWGNNEVGQIGIAGADSCVTSIGARPCFKAPTEVPWLKGASAIAIGDGHVCAMTTEVQCSGEGGSGQLGDGKTKSSATPVTVDGLGPNVLELVSGSNHVCALSTGTAASLVECWGDNGSKQIAATGGGTLSKPVEHHSCGDTKDCDVWAGGNMTVVRYGDVLDAAGANAAGQLGDGTTTDSVSTKPSGITGKNARFAIGESHTCAILDGALMCWGSNDFGQLGDGTYTARNKPAAVTP